MPEIDSLASALYERLTSDQLRDLLIAFFGTAKAQTLPQRSREQIIQQLNSASDPVRLARLAHQIEAVSPYKHCYPFAIQYQERWSFIELCKVFKERFPSLGKGFAPATTSGYEMQAQLYMEDRDNERLFLKIVHMVDVWETVTKNAEERTKKRIKSRHVVVAQFLPKTGAVTISFPGFTQALAGGDQSSYVALATQAAALIQDSVGVQIEAISLKTTSDAVLNDGSANVIDIGRKLNLSGINLAAYSTGDHADFASVLSSALAVDCGITVTAEKIKGLAEKMPGDDIHLLWRKLGIITRISVRETPNEIFFVWSKTQPSTALIDVVLGTMFRYREINRTDSSKEAWQYLEAAAAHFVVLPFYLTQRFSIGVEQAFSLLFQASKNGLFETRYRVAKDLSPDFPNRWVANLRDIPADVITDDGEELSTRNPDVIEIGFERVRG